MPDQHLAETAPLIVIDLQTSMFDGVAGPPIHDAGGIVDRARALIGWARATGRKVAFVRHDGPPGDPLAPGAPGWPVWPQLGQAGGEPTFSKSVGNAFADPALSTWVTEQGSGEVILLGAQSDRCVAASVEGAMRAGLEVVVVADAHSTWPSDGESAQQIIARQNEAFAAAGARLVCHRSLLGLSPLP